MSPMASQITSLTIAYSAVHSGTDQREHQSSASLAFVRGIHRWPVNSPHKDPVKRKMFPFDDVIMITVNTDIPSPNGRLWTKFSEITIKIQKYSVRKNAFILDSVSLYSIFPALQHSLFRHSSSIAFSLPYENVHFISAVNFSFRKDNRFNVIIKILSSVVIIVSLWSPILAIKTKWVQIKMQFGDRNMCDKRCTW